jgi:hypothetical protein
MLIELCVCVCVCVRTTGTEISNITLSRIFICDRDEVTVAQRLLLGEALRNVNPSLSTGKVKLSLCLTN